jgi:hypothetical protein
LARPFIEPDAARATSTPSHQPFLLLITWLPAGPGFNNFNALVGNKRRESLFLPDVTMPHRSIAFESLSPGAGAQDVRAWPVEARALRAPRRRRDVPRCRRNAVFRHEGRIETPQGDTGLSERCMHPLAN